MKFKQLFHYKGNLIFSGVLLLGIYLIEIAAHLFNHNYPLLLTHMGFGDLFILFFFSYLLSFASRAVRTVMISGILFFTLAQITHYQYFGAYIQPISFHLLLNHAHEVISIFIKEINTIVLAGLLVMVLGVLIYLVTHRLGKRVVTSKRAPGMLVGIVLINTFLTYLILNHNPVDKLYHWQAKMVMPTTSSPAFINTFRSLTYYLVGIIPKKIFGNISMYSELPPPVIKKERPDINLILIIGESLRAEQLSLLGYQKNETTPRLQRIEGLQAKTIYASGIMTKTAVAGIINRLKHPGVSSQIASGSNNLFRLAKDNGFKTMFVSGQPAEDCVILENLIGKKSIDRFMTRSDFEPERSPYDIAFLHYLKQIDFDENNFIVFQQAGSHIPYIDQYPKSFRTFKSHYDNTVLYTDYVVSEIIKTLKERSKKPTYIIFTSDHGQMIHEEGLYGHGWFKKQIYRVPLAIMSYNTGQNRIDLNQIDSHFDMSTLVGALLGYNLTIDHNSKKEIFINGSDIDGLAGYLRIKIDGDQELSSEIIR